MITYREHNPRPQTVITLTSGNRSATIERLFFPVSAFVLKRTEVYPETGAEYHFEDLPRSYERLVQALIDWMPLIDRELIQGLGLISTTTLEPSTESEKDYAEFLKIQP